MNDFTISVTNISKHYYFHDTSSDRLKQYVLSRIEYLTMTKRSQCFR